MNVDGEDGQPIREERELPGGKPVVDPKVYGSLLVVGAALLIVGQSTLSMVGIDLLVTVAFIGIVDPVSGT